MSTFKSIRHKMRHPSRWSRANLPEAKARAKAAAETRSMALPRDYPAYVPGFEVVRITVEAAGCAHVLQLLVPPQHGRRRPRSDQFAAIEDGAAWPKFGTRTQASAWVAKILPRLFSRDELAMMG